ncbi:MAG: flagellin [Proteobacteria bacterium]|nr:flagellin [Pseudomonadota bacterium]
MVNISDKSLNQTLQRHLEEAGKSVADATEKLASGSNFTRNDPRPADRAIAEGLEQRVRSLSAAKRNINDGVSLVQTADSALSQINDMVMRMKEINVAASNSTINDRERRYLFVEYEALHDEVNRIAESTTFNGLPLLNGNDPSAPEQMFLRVDDPFMSDNADNDEGDINLIQFTDLKSVIATTAGLGLRSAKDLLTDSSSEEGISVEDVFELMAPDDDQLFATIYDEAIHYIADQRAVVGSIQSRLERAIDFNEVFSENVAAAKSHISDTDYAFELSRLASAKILQQAGTAVMAQTNFTAGLTMNLIQSVMR